MKPIQIIKKLNEGTDWEDFKAGLSSCKNSLDLEELMNETMTGSDFSKYCDYFYEIDDEDKSSLQSAKRELRKLADEQIKYNNKYVLYSSMISKSGPLFEPRGEDVIVDNKLFDSLEAALQYYLEHKDENIVGLGKADGSMKRRLDHYGYDIKSMKDLKRLEKSFE